jgi:hypothetical protein
MQILPDLSSFSKGVSSFPGAAGKVPAVLPSVDEKFPELADGRCRCVAGVRGLLICDMSK